MIYYLIDHSKFKFSYFKLNYKLYKKKNIYFEIDYSLGLVK